MRIFSRNEIYDILVSDSRIYSEYIGKTFTYASFHSVCALKKLCLHMNATHRLVSASHVSRRRSPATRRALIVGEFCSFGVCVVGVKSAHSRIQLNPGSAHIVQGSDRFYYLGLTNEESLSEFHKLKQKTAANSPKTSRLNWRQI